MSPDGNIVAAGELVFSAGGRYLAAVFGSRGGLRVCDRDKNWSEAFRDETYGNSSYGVALAYDGRGHII